jgi:hypothetical protein
LALRIYFFNHHETSEEHKFLFGIRREKEAFEKLISERGVRPFMDTAYRQYIDPVLPENALGSGCSTGLVLNNGGATAVCCQFKKCGRTNRSV